MKVRIFFGIFYYFVVLNKLVEFSVENEIKQYYIKAEPSENKIKM